MINYFQMQKVKEMNGIELSLFLMKETRLNNEKNIIIVSHGHI